MALHQEITFDSDTRISHVVLENQTDGATIVSERQ